MNRFALLRALPAVLLISAEGSAASASDVLARLDAAAPSFRGATARLRRQSYTAVIKDTTEESGTMALLKGKGKDLRMLIEFQKPDARTVAVAGRKAEIFYPKITTVQEYDLGKYGKLVDQFLLLGFGTPGKELTRSYSVTMTGEETIGGKKTTRLELTPKAADVRTQLAKVELWVPDGSAYPIQQKFHQPSGDYTLVTYSDVQVNPTLTASAVQLQLPAGTKREYPQR